MKKIILSLLILTAAFPCEAQKNPLKWFKSLRKSSVREEPVQFITKQGKKFPAAARPVVSSRQLDLEKYIAREARISHSRLLPFATTPHTLEQAEDFVAQYRETMKKFQKFKQETTPFLYYRMKNSSKTDVLPREHQYLLSATLDMERDLLRVCNIVESEKDKPLAFALEYVTRVRDEVAPALKGMSGKDIFFARSDRKFVADEFYLHENEFKRWGSMFRRGQALAQAKNLPPGLRVAVLNARVSVLDQMQKSHKKGIFIRGGQLDGYLRADQLIEAVRGGKKYDLILTDIIVPGGGGYYLTNVLRLDGFSGAIIALSAFERDDSMSMDMFARGFDGILNLPSAFEFSPFWESDVMRGLNKYFQLKRIYNWQH